MRLFDIRSVIFISRGMALTLALAISARAQDFIPITTMQVTEYTTAAMQACANWRVVGICTWLVCDEICWTEVTVRYGHYSPDLTIASYDQPLENPWVEISTVLAAYNAPFTAATESATAGIGAGGGHTTDQVNDGQGIMRFKYTDAVGNPALGSLVFDGFTCDVTADPLTPYFTSESDILAWRLIDPVGAMEMLHPYTLSYPLPGVPRSLHRNVASSSIAGTGADWGDTYPRAGFVRQMHEYKAAAVAATKAAAIVTSPDPTVWGHVAQSIAVSASDQMRWLPPEIESGNNTTGVWQQLYPYMEATCSVFPDVDDVSGVGAASPVDPWVHRISESGNYLWNLWRPYSCCDRPDDGATTLISSTGTYP